MTVASPPVSETELARAYAHCRQVTRRRARNFYYGLRLTPEPKRSAVYSVYAWMRHGDDLVDSAANPSLKRRRLEGFSEMTERALDDPREAERCRDRDERAMWTAFSETIRRFGIDRADIEQMLQGLAEDIEHQGYETEEELTRYCRRVASSVGRVCVTIWGLREGVGFEDALKRAEQRGLSFQLTNILRDFAEDYDEGRVYLPRKSFRDAGITPEDLRAWRDPSACEVFVKHRAAIARRRFEDSRGLEGMINPDCAPTLWAMTRIYSGLLEKIEARPGRVVARARIRLQSLHKAGIAVRALARSRKDRW